MNFAVFDSEGNAVRIGSCPDERVQDQAMEGETVIEWTTDKGSPANWMLIDGELVEK